MAKKTLQGIIVSDKMQKTVVVEVESIKEHPKYKRRYKSHNRFKAHDEKGEYHTFVYDGPIFEHPVLFHETGRFSVERYRVSQLARGSLA